jgi:hypothetical protein
MSQLYAMLTSVALVAGTSVKRVSSRLLPCQAVAWAKRKGKLYCHVVNGDTLVAPLLMFNASRISWWTITEHGS